MAGSLLEPLIDALPSDPATRTRFARLDVWKSLTERFGFSYSELVWISFTGGSSIVLHFSSHTVSIKGQALEPLYIGLLRQEVSELQAVDERYELERKDGPTIERVHVMPKGSAVHDEASGGIKIAPPPES